MQDTELEEFMIDSQMLKGTLEGCILAIISKNETYGFEISEQLSTYGFGKIAEGTVYPLLLRLEKNQLVSPIYRQSNIGPRRKYYTLTEKGNTELKVFLKSYYDLSTAINKLLKDTEVI